MLPNFWHTQHLTITQAATCDIEYEVNNCLAWAFR